MRYLHLNSVYNNLLARICEKPLNYQYIIQIIFAFCLPFSRNLSSVLTIILLAIWLSKGNFLKKLKIILTNKYALLFTSIFFIPFFSLIYSTDVENGLFNIEKILSVLIFPLVLFSSPRLTSSQVNKILISFCLGCFTATSISLFNALLNNFQLNRFENLIPGLYDTNMVNILGISHVYFGLYLAFAILIITNATINKQPLLFNREWVQILICICLLLYLILLGAKMSIIAIFLILMINLSLYIIRSGRYVLALCCGIGLIIFFYLSINIFPVTKERFEALSNADNYQIGDNQWNSIASRISIFYCTNQILKNDWLLGAGIGDAQQELNECFKSNKFGTLYNMNAHNQFLQYIITSGVLTLAAFILCLTLPLIKFMNMKKEKFLYINFLLLFAICCLTESMMESNKGIVFYAYFNSLLFLHVKNNNE